MNNHLFANGPRTTRNNSRKKQQTLTNHTRIRLSARACDNELMDPFHWYNL
jgi:hypothetical protein